MNVENAHAELPLYLEDIIFEKGKGQVEVTTSILVDQRRDTSVGPASLVEIFPGVFINIPGHTTTKDEELRQITSVLGVRYGLTSGIELFGRVSGFASWIDRIEGTNNRSSDSDANFRDAWLGLNYQALKEDGKPGLFLTAEGVVVEQNSVAYRGRILNSSSWLRTFLVGATIYRQFDPVVLSGSLGYRVGLKRDVEDVTYHPGDAVIWNMITTFAANERLSINGGLSGVVQSPSKINGSKQGQTRNDISLVGGVSMAVTKRWSVTVLVQGGLTETATDVVIPVKIGWRFK